MLKIKSNKSGCEYDQGIKYIKKQSENPSRYS